MYTIPLRTYSPLDPSIARGNEYFQNIKVHSQYIYQLLYIDDIITVRVTYYTERFVFVAITYKIFVGFWNLKKIF